MASVNEGRRKKTKKKGKSGFVPNFNMARSFHEARVDRATPRISAVNYWDSTVVPKDTGRPCRFSVQRASLPLCVFFLLFFSFFFESN